MEVRLTESDLSQVEMEKRRKQVEINRKKVRERGKSVILTTLSNPAGIEIPYETKEYPVEDVVLYSSKVGPENRMLGHHYECVITFRGVEFYSMEQLYSSLKFNERPYILDDIMTAPNGVTAKRRSHKYQDMYLYDSDFNLKHARLNVMVFLFKYLSVPEFRNRLRELRNATLFENKGDYEGGNRYDETGTKLVGRNSDGRAMMAVRDMMLEREDKAIAEAEAQKGGALTSEERETVLKGVLDAVREEFENDPQVKADSDNVINYIFEHQDIIPLKRYWPKEDAKVLLVEFDDCVFDTSADDAVRKAPGARITAWVRFFNEYIPQYKLHDGWREVFDWAKKNDVMIGVMGKAKAELVRRTFAEYDFPCHAVVYAGRAGRQHGYDIMDRMKVRPHQILGYVGSSLLGQRQAKQCGFKFIGSSWGAVKSFKGETCIASPKDLLKMFVH